jgi:fatty acid-binding protein DegV
MIEAVKRDFSERFANSCSPEDMNLMIAYTRGADFQGFRDEVAADFPGFPIHSDPLSLSVSCHIGPGALALAFSKKVKI